MIQIAIYNHRIKQKLIQYRFKENDYKRINNAIETLNKEIKNTPFNIIVTKIT